MKLIVLLHGYGASGTDLRGLFTPWRAEGREFISPNAPDLCAGMGPGYEWFGLDGWMPGTSFDKHIGRIERAAEKLKIQLQNEVAQRGLQWSDVVLMGFSQGAIMALAVGLSEPMPCAGIMAYSGAYLIPVPPESKSRVLLVHGGMDNVVAPDAYYDAKKLFEAYDVPNVSKLIPSCGHWIDPEGMQAGADFLKDVI